MPWPSPKPDENNAVWLACCISLLLLQKNAIALFDHLVPLKSLVEVAGVITFLSGITSCTLVFGRWIQSVNNGMSDVLKNKFSPIGVAFLSKTSVSIWTIWFRIFAYWLVSHTRNPIGKFPFNPSNALLWTTKPPRYFAFQFSRNFASVGELTCFNVLNIASVAFGISMATRTMNCVNKSLLAFPYLATAVAANLVLPRLTYYYFQVQHVLPHTADLSTPIAFCPQQWLAVRLVALYWLSCNQFCHRL